MKICPTCGEVYPDQSTECRAHNTELHDWTEATETHSGDPTSVDDAPDDTDALFDAEQMMTAGEFTEPELHLPDALVPSRSVSIDPSLFKAAPKPRRVLGGRYRLGQHIGIGGYGAVFDAYDERLNKRVAVKLLSPAVCQDADVVERFQREALAASRVRHECIVDVTDFDVDPAGTSFIVMEYLDGCDLSDVIDDDGPLAPARVLAIAVQCASALTAAHGSGILHRDLKPANIFLVNSPSRSDFVKIIDFGISKITGTDGKYTDVTSASRVVGTPFYMAPEHARGKALDGRTDVYALGVILYEMLTDTRPFTGASALDILTKAMNAPRVPPSRVRPALAQIAGLDQLVLGAIAIDREKRFESMEVFGKQIHACLLRLDETLTFGLPAIASVSQQVEPPQAQATATLANATTNVHPGKPSTLDTSSGELTSVRNAGRSWRWAVPAAAAAIAALVVFGVSGGESRRGASPATSADSDHKTALGTQPASVQAPALPPKQTAPTARVQALTPTPPSASRARMPAASENAQDIPAKRVAHKLRLTSSPSGAKVSKRGHGPLGVTPLDVTLTAEQQSAKLSVEIAGRRKRTLTIDRQSTSTVHVELTRRRAPRAKAKRPKSPKTRIKSSGIKDW